MALSKINRNSLNTGISDSSDATAVTIDSSENVGIGTAPESHHANWTAIDFGDQGGLAHYDGGATSLSTNLYHNGGWKAKETGTSSRYEIGAGGTHNFYSGASASADAAVTLTNTLSIDANGVVSKPKQPCFRARRTNTAGTTQGFTSNITFNSEDADLGNNYDTSNGRFTAPIAGTYYFSHAGLGASGSTASVHSTGASWHLEFLKNGVRTGFQFYWYSGHPTAGGSQHHYINSYMDMIITLAANDYITVQLPDGTDSYYSDTSGAYDTYFQGFLIA